MFRGKWSDKFTNILIWVSGYVSFIAFAVVGGYMLLKGNEKQKQTTKMVFIFSLIFLAVSTSLGCINTFGGMFNGYYSSWVSEFCSVVSRLNDIAEASVFATFIVIELLKKDKPEVEKPVNEEQPVEENK